MDNMSLGERRPERAQPPQFHEFGMARGDTVGDINMDSLRLEEKATPVLPTIVVSSPERGIPEGAAAAAAVGETFFDRLSQSCEDFYIGNNMSSELLGQDN